MEEEIQMQSEIITTQITSVIPLTESVYSTEYFINENKILKSQLEFLQKENSNFKKEIQKLNNDIISKNDQNILNENKVNRLEKLNQEMINKNKNLNDDNTNLRNELQKLIENNSNNLNKINSLTKDNQNLNNNLILSKQEVNQKENIIKNLIQENQNLNLDIMKLNNEILFLKSEIHTEKIKLDSTNSDLTMKRNQINSQENLFNLEIQNLRDQLNFTKDQFNLKNEEFILKEQKFNIKLFELQSANQNFNSQLENNLLRLEENKLNFELKDKKIEELSKIILELQRHIKQSESQIEMCKDLINDKENEIKNLYSVKRRLDEYNRIEKTINYTEIISVNDIQILKEDFKKISNLYQTCKKDLEISNMNNEIYRQTLKDYEIIKEKLENLQNSENENLQNYQKLLINFEIISKKNEEDERELEISNEFTKKLSKQNRELLMEIKLREGRSSLMGTNLSKNDYEDFIYKNINDLESKFSELTKRYIQIKIEKENLENDFNKNNNLINEKNEIIQNLESFVKELDEQNSNLKKEFEMLKYHSNGHYSLFTLKSGNINEEDIQNLKDELENNKIKLKSLQSENEKLSNNLQEIENKKYSITQENLSNKNKLLEMEKDKNNQDRILSQFRKMKIDDENLISNLKSDLNNLKSQNEEIKLNADLLFKQKENLIQNLKLTIEELNRQLNESNLNFKQQIQNLLNENESLKDIMKMIQKDIVEISHKINLESILSADVNVENQIRDEVTLFKQKFELKEKEFLQLKLRKTELEIKLENVMSENSTIKFTNEFLENRIKYYQNILGQNINEENINIIHYNENVPLNENLNNLNILDQKYLECLKQLENLKSENQILIIKNSQLNNLNQQLVKNDIVAPYKYLFNKIEELNNNLIQLENEKINLISEKENLIKDYSFININSETQKRNIENLQTLIIELNERIKEQETNQEMYLQSQNIINGKQTEINQLRDEINKINSDKFSLENQIKLLEQNLVEKENLINDNQTQMNALIEIKNKEISESKAKYFKMFYLSFKKAKSVIQVLIKIKENFEEKFNEFKNYKNESNYDRDYIEINNRINQYEITINNLKRKLKETEEENQKNLDNFNKELELQKDKENILINEIKTFKNINAIEGSVDMRPHFIKMLKSLTSAMNIMKFKDIKMKQMEEDLKSLQNKIFEKNLENVIVSKCEKCEILNLEVNFLSCVNRELNEKLKRDENEIIKLDKKLLKLKVENDLVGKDLINISNYVKNNEPNEPKPQTEKNRIFTQLMNQMRKATKIISVLEKNLNNRMEL